MNIKLINQLNILNHIFYKTVAVSFDDSRQYFWEGWDKIPPLLDGFKDIRVADIACGNGRFGQFLTENSKEIKVSYTGIDANKKLLEFAENNLEGKIPALHLNEVDIISAIQNNEDFLKDQEFKLITSFGFFHHIPSFELRLKSIKYLLSKLSKDGYLVISFWQFMQYERFRKKVVKDKTNFPSIDFDLNDLEKDDYILDWKRGKNALRYCHNVGEDEQKELINKSESKLIDEYFADGKEGNVNKYIVLTHKDLIN